MFSCKFFEKKYYIVLTTTNLAALSRGCKPRIYPPTPAACLVPHFSLLLRLSQGSVGNTRKLETSKKCEMGMWKRAGTSGESEKASRAPRVSLAPKTPFPFPF